MTKLASVLCLLAVSFIATQDDKPPQDISVPSEAVATEDDSKAEPEPMPSAPRSMPGVVTMVADPEGNEYPFVVVQSLALVQEQVTVTKYKSEARERIVKAANGESQTQAYTVTVPVQETVERPVMAERMRHLVPLSAATLPVRVSGGMAILAEVAKPGTHVLVAASPEDAREVAEELRQLARKQMALTGLQARLPEYIIALSNTPRADEAAPLDQALQRTAPYKGAATFFGKLELKQEDADKAVESR